MKPGAAWRLGVDVGGTFTDLILVGPRGRVLTRKVLSTPHDYAEGILVGMREMIAAAAIEGAAIGELVHGTTVATNAILERRGARTALITTEGFRDLLEIGRLRLARLYDINHQRPVPLVRRRWRLEVAERMDRDGKVVRALDMAGVEAAIDALLAEGVDAVGVCLMHAYANADHEQRIAAAIRARAPHLHLSLSSDVLPEIREFERTSTTVTNAYVMPVMDRYLATLERETRAIGMTAPLFIMQSNGGVMPAARARRYPVQLIESGPAAGVIAAAALAKRAKLPNVISMDMGGTTAKASVIENYELRQSHELEIGGEISKGSRLNKGGGYLLRTPAIDIAEVGAGGGSIVSVDDAGALHVGPRSAGAAPGPACYDRGGSEPTLTDANVVLGYLAQDRLPSGLELDAEKARQAVAERVAQPLKLKLAEAAHGVYLVGCAGLARAVRAVTVERGRDPREFALVAFGGNGPLFAAELARGLEIGTVIVPPAPGVFSAVGLLEAELEFGVVRTWNQRLGPGSGGPLREMLDALARQAEAMARAEGFLADAQFVETADVKYAGQSYELTVKLMRGADGARLVNAIARDFAREHERTYGHAADDPIQIVNLRVSVRVATRHGPPALGRHARGAAATTRAAYFGKRLGAHKTPVIDRGDLGAKRRKGPLLIDEYDATTLVPPGCAARLDKTGNIIIDIKE